MENKAKYSEQQAANLLSEYIDDINEGKILSVSKSLNKDVGFDIQLLLDVAVFVKENTRELPKCDKTEGFKKIRSKYLEGSKMLFSCRFYEFESGKCWNGNMCLDDCEYVNDDDPAGKCEFFKEEYVPPDTGELHNDR